jgi:Right handed beta helix region
MTPKWATRNLIELPMSFFRTSLAAWAAWLIASAGVGHAAVEVVSGDESSLQKAIDANPGRMVFVPAGDYVISAPLKLGSNNSGLWGPGTIIQANPEADIINVEGVSDIQLKDLTLTRAAGKMETHRGGVRVVRCENVKIDNVRIADNRGDLASIFAAYCKGLQIRNCSVQNYSRIAIDDRTTIPHLGYAFTAINGTGMLIRHSTDTLIQNNRIIETIMIPTPELQKKYQLGKFTKKAAQRGQQASQEMWDAEYFNGWHQGAAIQITKGETSDYVQLIGNYIENAAQGIDIHGDHVIMAYNIINNAFIGMKAMHGSRNVIIIGNQLLRNDLWSIQLQPGTASHAAFSNEQASAPDPVDPEALTWSINRPGANIDGESIVANNIISDFGYGTAHWMWPSANTAPIQFNVSPDPARSPPETNVIISGNILHDTGRDQILVDGKPRVEPPHYKYAVRIGTGEHGPRGLHFSDNLFHPGIDGVSNVELPK